MTVYIESIIDTEATLDDADRLAQIVVANLCDRKIILPTPQINEYLEHGPRYATGPKVLKAAERINECFPCGMDVSVGRQVFDTGELGFDLFCPHCTLQVDKDTIDWDAPIGRWYESGDVGTLTCSACSVPTPFTQWFRPSFGFGNLAFRFSEWCLTPDFVAQISALLGHRVTWVKAQY